MRRSTSRGTKPCSSHAARVRLDLGLDEAAHLRAQHLVLLAEVNRAATLRRRVGNRRCARSGNTHLRIYAHTSSSLTAIGRFDELTTER